jgi:hypothetical protein
MSLQPHLLTTQNLFPTLNTAVTNLGGNNNGNIIYSPTENNNNNVESPVSLTSSRRSSVSYIDESLLAKYCYPQRQYTYPAMPSHMHHSSTSSLSLSLSQPMQVMSSQVSYSSSHADYQHSRSQSLASDYSFEMPPEPAPHATTTTLLSYLSAANPTPNLVRQINLFPSRSIRDQGNTHFWWDIRSVRTWKSFNLASLEAVPHLTQLLNTEISDADLPAPKVNREYLDPETEQSLHLLYRDFYAEKLTNALKIALGTPNLAMRAFFPGGSASAPGGAGGPGLAQRPSSRNPPEFVSNYTQDFSGRIFGEGHGRVVGLVKSFHRWNSGMRSEGPQKRVDYLKGLSHLHRHMREHGTRYGFIITEIELVCVSLVCNEGSNVPLYGALMLSPPISLNVHTSASMSASMAQSSAASVSSSSSPGGPAGATAAGLADPSKPEQLTACLALFYLHFLSKNHPPPGQPSYKLDVGGPSACTRQSSFWQEKEKWIPTPQMHEKREAKRVRGWVWPEDPLSRKELPKRGK